MLEQILSCHAHGQRIPRGAPLDSPPAFRRSPMRGTRPPRTRTRWCAPVGPCRSRCRPTRSLLLQRSTGGRTVTAVDRPPADSPSEETAAHEARTTALRGQYRTLPDMEARQRAIAPRSSPKLDQPDRPGRRTTSRGRSTLIQEHDDLDDARRAAAQARRSDLTGSRARTPTRRTAKSPEPRAPRTCRPATSPGRTRSASWSGSGTAWSSRGRSAAAPSTRSRCTPTAATWRHDFAENATRLAQDQFSGPVERRPAHPGDRAARSTTTRSASTCRTRRGVVRPCLADPHLARTAGTCCRSCSTRRSS